MSTNEDALKKKIATTLEIERQKILDILERNHSEEVAFDLNEFIQQIKVLESFSFNKNRYFAIFDQQLFRAIYISENYKKFGYTLEKVNQLNIFELIKIITWKQFPYILKILHADKHPVVTKIHQLPIHQREAYSCGYRFRDAKGKLWRLFLKHKFLVSSGRGNVPRLSFLEVETINHLVKKDIAWFRVIGKNEDISLKLAVFLDTKKRYYDDVLSERELEILKLHTQNKNNQEISHQLAISLETVKAHKKRMLARTGAKDMSALVYLCESCKIL